MLNTTRAVHATLLGVYQPVRLLRSPGQRISPPPLLRSLEMLGFGEPLVGLPREFDHALAVELQPLTLSSTIVGQRDVLSPVFALDERVQP